MWSKGPRAGLWGTPLFEVFIEEDGLGKETENRQRVGRKSRNCGFKGTKRRGWIPVLNTAGKSGRGLDLVTRRLPGFLAKMFQWSKGRSDWIGLRSEYLEEEKVHINCFDCVFKKAGYDRRGQQMEVKRTVLILMGGLWWREWVKRGRERNNRIQ